MRLLKKKTRCYIYTRVSTAIQVDGYYIAQVKAKYGIIERENYNKPKS